MVIEGSDTAITVSQERSCWAGQVREYVRPSDLGCGIDGAIQHTVSYIERSDSAIAISQKAVFQELACRH